MSACRLCQSKKVGPLLNLGNQPLCNRFLAASDVEEATFPFALGQCQACGMMQILNPAPEAELKPRFSWISYREAEGHLDELVEEILKLPGVATTSSVGWTSVKDESTVERLQKKGLASTTGTVDILLVRHILEHAHDTAAFVKNIKRRVTPGGYLVIELPDCGPGLARLDYTMPWEEHILYFTEDLLRQAVKCWGLPAVFFKLYPYSHENSLVVILQMAGAKPSQPDPVVTNASLKAGERFAHHFDGLRNRVNEALTKFRLTKGKIAVFGAGHLSCTWVNVFGIHEHIDFIVDDDPHKGGLFMPGSRLPILPSSQLVERGVRLCLLSLNQESEVKVIGKNQNFLSNGGTFASIFPGRANSFISEATL